MNERSNRLTFPEPEPLLCASCGSPDVRTVTEDQPFTYGVGDAEVTLHATVPVRICDQCDFSYTDEKGEEARHEAVCRHLGVMTPSEVRNVRERHGLNRAEFARVTGLGEASLARWESGSLVQNVANDNLLYLLLSQESVEALRCRDRSLPVPNVIGSGQPVTATRPARFRYLKETDELRIAAASFTLRAVNG